MGFIMVSEPSNQVGSPGGEAPTPTTKPISTINLLLMKKENRCLLAMPSQLNGLTPTTMLTHDS